MSILYLGRKAPKGYREVGPAMHLGKGVWMLRIEPIEPLPVLEMAMPPTTSGNGYGTTITYAGSMKMRARRPARKAKVNRK